MRQWAMSALSLDAGAALLRGDLREDGVGRLGGVRRDGSADDSNWPREQPGFLGVDSARSEGVGITVSYWETEADIVAWKAHAEHSIIRETGRARWYDAYELRVARVERAYGWRR